jgi:hypothetical protein
MTASPAMVVTGTVTLGPLCPVERVGTPCPASPRAFDHAQVSARNGANEVRAPVSPTGDFTLNLSDGTWLLTADAGMSCTTVTISHAGQVAIDCDTGIR